MWIGLVLCKNIWVYSGTPCYCCRLAQPVISLSLMCSLCKLVITINRQLNWCVCVCVLSVSCMPPSRWLVWIKPWITSRTSGRRSAFQRTRDCSVLRRSKCTSRWWPIHLYTAVSSPPFTVLYKRSANTGSPHLTDAFLQIELQPRHWVLKVLLI